MTSKKYWLSLAGSVLVLCFVLFCGCSSGVTQKQPTTMSEFNAWFNNHSATCKQCGGGPNQAICMTAFKLSQQCMKNDKE